MNRTIHYDASNPTLDYAWTISVLDKGPKLTSDKCAAHLTEFMKRPALLSVASEASSHPAGLESLYAQPWLWAGGGLGNMDECPLQTCLAGAGNGHDSPTLLFAALCVIPECSAHDLAADDFPAAVQRAAQEVMMTGQNYQNHYRYDDARDDYADLGLVYWSAVQRMAQVNKYLGTGWTCGDFVVPWRPWPWGVPFLVVVAFCTTAVVAVSSSHGHGNTRRRAQQQRRQRKSNRGHPPSPHHHHHHHPYALLETKALIPTVFSRGNQNHNNDDNEDDDDEEEKKESETSTPLTATSSYSTLSFCWKSISPSSSSSSIQTSTATTEQQTEQTQGQIHATDATAAATTSISKMSKSGETNSDYNSKQHDGNNDYDSTTSSSSSSSSSTTIWSAFDARRHWNSLFHSVPETAVLDGLRVLSMTWILIGHVMAIQGNTGAGWANPAAILPPTGWTTTVPGQILFSSRLAVDTFLVLSGFLTVHVLVRKLPPPPPASSSVSTSGKLASYDRDGHPIVIKQQVHFVRRYLAYFPKLLVSRVVRILPLYAMCLLFYTQMAPQLGGGPFWYQWWALLKPCHDYGWTNLLFINNFWPPNQPITNTCFYHSWYLAVDMQLFLAGAVLVFWYQARPKQAAVATALLWMATVVFTSILAAIRGWSVNTFDGAAVARYDTEAYAKPWIRSVAYLTGMYLAMILPRHKLQRRGPWLPSHHVIMALTLLVMACITFGTAFGAYARRPCQYKDWPSEDDCGSTWSPAFTWFYASSSRTVWCICVAIVLHLCMGRTPEGNIVSAVLSWQGWTPLSHLTFGTYLIHPVVIFIWQLSDRSKTTFQLENFTMTTISVAVVSYSAALLAAFTVEFPCAALWKRCTSATKSTPTYTTADSASTNHPIFTSALTSQTKTPNPACPTEHRLHVVYGSVV